MGVDMLRQRKDPAGVRAQASALHEVGNVLTVVIGLLDRMASTADPGEARRLLRLAQSRADDGRRLARQAIGACVDGPPEDDSLGALLQEAREGLASRAAEAGVELSVELVDDALVGSPRALLQVVTNLLLNAARFSPPGTVVRVTARRAGDEVRIVVSDEGPGIPPERRATVFAGGTTDRLGAGIGLAHARALALEHGGDLSLGAAASEFVVVWPTQAPSSRELSSTRPEASIRGARCLVLDDDVSVLELLDTALTHRGAAVTLVKTAAAAVRALGESSFDVVLIDLSPFRGMPRAMLVELVAACGDAGVLVVSGSADREALGALPEAVSCLRKPFRIDDLVTAVTGLFRLDKRRGEGP